MIPLIITTVAWNKKREYQSPQLEVFVPCCVVVNNCCVVLTTNVQVIEVTLETRFCWTETSLSSQSKVSSALSSWFRRSVTDTKHKISLGDDLSNLDPKAFDRPFVVSAHLHTLKFLFYVMCGSTSSFFPSYLSERVSSHPWWSSGHASFPTKFLWVPRWHNSQTRHGAPVPHVCVLVYMLLRWLDLGFLPFESLQKNMNKGYKKSWTRINGPLRHWMLVFLLFYKYNVKNQFLSILFSWSGHSSVWERL